MTEIMITEKISGENNREYAYRILKNNIMSLKLLPGTTLNEGELSELFHMSRTPIHEAMIMLKEEALVSIYPQSGSNISYINVNILKEGYFLRSVIEPEIIRQLAGNMPSESMEKLKSNLDRQTAALTEPDNIDIFIKLDDEFHKTIYEAGKKSEVWYAIKRVSSHYDRVRYLDAIMTSSDLNSILKDHKKIYHILLIGYVADFDLRGFYDKHLGLYKKHFQEILEGYPEYFELE